MRVTRPVECEGVGTVSPDHVCSLHVPGDRGDRATATLRTSCPELDRLSIVVASAFYLPVSIDRMTEKRRPPRRGRNPRPSGTKATVHIYPDFGHAIPVRARDDEVSRFIDATLR